MRFQRGLSAPQLVIAMAVLGALIIGLLSYVGSDRLFTKSPEDKAPAGFYTKYLYARNRLDGMAAKIMLFQQATGRLPGDDPASGGNGDGRVAPAEAELVGKALHSQKAIPSPEMGFMNHELDFYWVDEDVFPERAPGHYFIVRGLEKDLAHYIDEQMDDGKATWGRVKYTPVSEDAADLYYRYTG